VCHEIIEAHEVAQDKRYDEEGGDTVMMGITGAVATALQGRNYGSKGDRRVGDEIAAGVVATQPKRPSMSPEMVMLMMALFDR
jgi:hypothetical protein